MVANFWSWVFGYELAVEGEVHNGSSGDVKGYEDWVGCMSTRREPPEERLGEEMASSGDEGDEGGPGPPNM